MASNLLTSRSPVEQPTEHPHVTRIVGVLDGVPLLRGTRIPVRLIAQLYRAGDSVDDILRSYPQLDAASIHDAISYYLDHRDEIASDIAANQLEQVLAEVGARVDEHGFIV